MLLGTSILFMYPPLRALITAPLRQKSSVGAEAIVVFAIVLLIAMAFWPVALLRSMMSTSTRTKTLTEIKSYLTQRGIQITEAYSVLLSFYNAVLRKLEEVARARAETLPSAISKEVSCH